VDRGKEVVGKGCRRVNIVQTLCTHVETVPAMGVGEIKESSGRGELKYDVL
jgi:hypothetical protein